MARISTDMGAHKATLRPQQGDSFSCNYTISRDGELIDFTGCTALLQVRERFGPDEPNTDPLLSLTGSPGIILGGTTGVITINLTPAQTQALLPRSRFQVRVTDTISGIVATLLIGEIKPKRSVIL